MQDIATSAFNDANHSGLGSSNRFAVLGKTLAADGESREPEAPELVADGATAVAAAAARLATSTEARLRRGPAAPVMQHVFRASLAGVLTRD